MHELAVTQGILDVVVAAAQQAGGYPVRSIALVIGDMSSIVDDSVQFYFDILSQGTLAQGATLHVRREPAQLTCWACGAQSYAVAPFPEACTQCGSNHLHVSGGRAFSIESIEVDHECPSSEVYSE